MTRKTKSIKAPRRKSKRLSLSKKTLKDLDAPGSGAQGGMGMKFVKTMVCTACNAYTCRKR